MPSAALPPDPCPACGLKSAVTVRFCNSSCRPTHGGWVQATIIGEPLWPHVHAACTACGFERLRKVAKPDIVKQEQRAWPPTT